MYRLLVLYLGAVTLLAFTEGAPVPSTTLLKAIQDDISMLNKSTSVISKRNFLVPTDIKATCLTNALACFVIELCSVRTVIEMEDEDNNGALNNIDIIMQNAYAYLGKENKSCHRHSPLRDLCKTCKQKQKSKQGGDFLTAFSNLLKSIVSSQ